MDKYFDRFLGLVEEAEAALPGPEYRQLIDDIHRVSQDKGAACRLPESVEWALNSGDGVYRP